MKKYARAKTPLKVAIVSTVGGGEDVRAWLEPWHTRPWCASVSQWLAVITCRRSNL